MNTFAALPREFYARTATEAARRLLGHWLVRRTEAGVCGGPIVEVEAYLENDPGAHGFCGETPRNRVMFGPPGRAYVYFIYGNHFCVNAVCRRAGIAEAVLVRAVEAEMGVGLLRANRPGRRDPDLTNGPGKLCAAMAIDRRLDGVDLCDAKGPLFIGRNPMAREFRRKRGPIATTRRVGLSRGADLELRFYLAASPFVSAGGGAG